MTRRRLFLICPAPAGSRSGNRITALRWARLIRQLGHRVTIHQCFDGRPADVLIALHARRSWESIRLFAREYPQRPLVVCLTGTDLYRDIHASRRAQQSLELATRLVVLQSRGLAELPRRLHAKTRVIYQSACPTGVVAAGWPGRWFRVCVLGHLRREKDPFRAALAARHLPESSRIRLVHLGAALDPRLERRTRDEQKRNPRYYWMGEVPHARARRLLARSQLLVLSSRMEGGANVLSEAIVDGVPILASRIPSTVGIMGAGYPGYFPVGDTARLTWLLRRAESDDQFYHRLRDWCVRLAPRFSEGVEREAWRRLLAEVGTVESNRGFQIQTAP